jgi:hypothetical protein
MIGVSPEGNQARRDVKDVKTAKTVGSFRKTPEKNSLTKKFPKTGGGYGRCSGVNLLAT